MKKLEFVECSYSAIKIGIIIEIPITGVGDSGFTQEMEGCPKCNRWEVTMGSSWQGNKRVPTGGLFCKNCGTQREIQERVCDPEPIPIPDIRMELETLKLEYEPFDEDLFWMPHSDRPGGGFALNDTDAKWTIFVEEVDVFGHRGDYRGGLLREYDLKDLNKKLEDAKKKYKDFIKKYNGRIYFGSVSCAIDW